MAPKANGFMIFTKEWKSKHGKGMSLQSAIDKAGKIWKEMDTKARAPYNEKAKSANSNRKQSNDDTFTCNGRSMQEVKQEKTYFEDKQRQGKRFIEMTVRNSCKEGTLLTKKYYFMKANYFTKTFTGSCYIPAEIALAEFNIKEGVTKTYHTMTNPGGELYGHYYEAQSYANETHMLPLPPKALGTRDLGKVYNDILEFIYDKDTDTYGPVYTHQKDLDILESVMTFLRADPSALEKEFIIHPIQYLLYILKDVACEIGEEEKIDSHHIVDVYFENDFFEYQSGISCEFHEENDRTKYCAASCVRRWGFMFCDFLCKHFAMDLIPGRHGPQQMKLNAIINEVDDTPSDNKTFRSLDNKKNLIKQENMPSHRNGRASKDDESFASSSQKCKQETEWSPALVAPPPPIISRKDADDSCDSDESYESPWARRKAQTKPTESDFYLDTSTKGKVKGYGRGNRVYVYSDDDSDNPVYGFGRGKR